MLVPGAQCLTLKAGSLVLWPHATLVVISGCRIAHSSGDSRRGLSGCWHRSYPGWWPNGPADWGAALSIGFDVTGLSGPISDLSLSVTLRHSYVGDLEAVLVPPSGSEGSPFVLFSRVGQPEGVNVSGSSALLSVDPNGNEPGTYTFSDHASGNLWSSAGFDLQTGTADFESVANIPAVPVLTGRVQQVPGVLLEIQTALMKKPDRSRASPLKAA